MMPLINNLKKIIAVISRKEVFSGYLFAPPWICGFLAFTLVPIVLSFYYSLCRYDVLRPPMFVGLQNYYYLLFESDKFYKAVYNTVFFTVFRVPLVIVGSLLLALLLSTPRRGIALARTIYYMPSIITGVALSVIWLWMYNPKYGLINRALA
ncbi:MAG: sugar ABC transporter permease, partial [Candidatus Sumerlaeia bacterium]|nr:sugar ABC transporter permease [Candidatus Sumerlaeia bacterium]